MISFFNWFIGFFNSVFDILVSDTFYSFFIFAIAFAAPVFVFVLILKGSRKM